MRRIDELLVEYGESHQNPVNKLIHWICVPLIFFSVIGLITSIPSDGVKSVLGPENPNANWAAPALIVLLIYYVTLSIWLSIGMMLFSAFCMILANFIVRLDIGPLWLISLIIFAVAWVAQFYGHKVEGRKPSFFKDVQFLLIGPAWLMHFIYKRLRIPY